MRIVKKIILTLSLVIFFGCGDKPLDPKFAVMDHLYYFEFQLKKINMYGFEPSERYQYGKFDFKTATLSLIPTDGSWEFKKFLKLKHYKDNVFYVEGYDQFYIYFNLKKTMYFVTDKENPTGVNSITDVGVALSELTSIEACKEHAEKIRIEFESLPELPQGQE